jgi:hypothetical protein
MSCEYPADMAQAKVSQSASFPQSPKLKEVTATLQDVVIDKREEIKICGGGEMFDNRFKRIQNSTLFQEDCAST